MKKFLGMVLIFFCLTAFLFAPTYYVKPDGDNTKDGLSIANAWETIQKAADTVVANDLVRILPGTYSEQVQENTAGPITYEAYDPQNKPIIDGENVRTRGFNVYASDLTIRNVKATRATTNGFVQAFGDNVTFEGCESYENGAQGFAFDSGDGHKMSFCRGHKNTTGDYYSKAVVDVEYCIFSSYKGDSETVKAYQAILAAGKVVNFYNCIFTQGRATAVRKANVAGTVNLKNCLVLANGRLGKVHALYNEGGGALTYQNCHILPQWAPDGWVIGSNVTDLGGNIIGEYPGIKGWGGYGYVALRVDDYISYAEGWAGKADEYSVHISFYANQTMVESEANYANRLQTLVAGGHEVGGHGYSHYDLTSTQLFIIQYDGTDTSPTIDVDQTARTVELRTVEGNDDETIVAIDTKTFGDLTAELAATNWSVTGLGDPTFAYYDDVWLSGLQDTSGAVALAGIPPVRTMDLNQAAFLTDELDDVKDWLDATIGGGYQVKSLAYPFNNHNESVRDGVRDAGYAIATADYSYAGGADLTDFEIFGTYSVYFDALRGDGTEAVIRRNTRAFLARLAHDNLMGTVAMHNYSAALLTQFGYFLDEVTSFDGVACLTMKELATMVRDSGEWADADGDGERWTRTFIDNSDYRLEATSPCVDAGADVGLTQDYMGTTVPQGVDPDIGAYEYYAYTIKLKDGAKIKLKDGGKVKIK